MLTDRLAAPTLPALIDDYRLEGLRAEVADETGATLEALYNKAGRTTDSEGELMCAAYS